MAIYFPENLKTQAEHNPFMLFTPYKWTTAGRRTLTPTLYKSSQPPENSIALPLPTNGLSESYDSDWEGAENLQITGGKQAALKLVKNQLQQQASELFQYTQYQKGQLLNDFASVAYGGINFREFTFEFTLIPNNESEAISISNIILEFKRNMLPDYTSTFIEYPSFYNIHAFFPHINTSLIKYKDLVITNMTTNYFPDSILTVFRTGHPIKIDLSITVKELDKFTRADLA